MYTISYSGESGGVPQNCEVNAGRSREFDFGDIGASLFSRAGRVIVTQGGHAANENIALLNVPTSRRRPCYRCGEARPQGERDEVSDNPDLGFVVC